MYGKRYVVVSGDNLWDIAKTHMGGGNQWPRIWRYNNRREVIQSTGRGIPNPDLIYVGQVLYLPVLPTLQQPAAGATAPVALVPAVEKTSKASTSPQPLRTLGGPLSQQLPNIQSPISFKYRLDDIRFPPIDTPTALVEYRVTGDVVFMSKKSYPALYVTTRKEIELQITREMNNAFGKIIQDNRFIYNPTNNSITLRTMMVSQSNTPNAPSTAVGVEMSSNTPIPKLRAEFRFPKLEGQVDGLLYNAFDIKFVIEITPKMRFPLGPSPQPVRVPVMSPAFRTAPARSTDWSTVIGTGLIIVAGVIIVATVVEDFGTLGAGVADDPLSFAAAGSSFARGMALVRGALPAAAAPATVRMGGTLQFAH